MRRPRVYARPRCCIGCSVPCLMVVGVIVTIYLAVLLAGLAL
ncbi:MAG: hypothetical protein ACREN1_00265 [Candidatus Dormibacteria bacterium]